MSRHSPLSVLAVALLSVMCAVTASAHPDGYDYLGLATGKTNAAGKGQSTAVTPPEDCQGGQPTAKLITCLHPDRRGDPNLSGFR